MLDGCFMYNIIVIINTTGCPLSKENLASVFSDWRVQQDQKADAALFSAHYYLSHLMTIRNARFDQFSLAFLKTHDLWFLTLCFWQSNSGCLDEHTIFIYSDKKRMYFGLPDTVDEAAMIL